MESVVTDWKNLTWTCHICKQERPDAFISVYQRKYSEFITENIRYCNDIAECREGAKTYTHFTH